MPFAPNVSYRGDQYLFQGAANGLNNLGAYLLQKADEHKRVQDETQSADVAFKFLTPLLQNDTTAIQRFGDETAKFPGASLSQKKAMIGGITMYLAQKAEQEKQQREAKIQQDRQGFNTLAASAFGPDGIDLTKIGAALKQYPNGVDVEKLLSFAQRTPGKTEAKAKVPATTKLAGRDVVYSPDTGAFQLLNDPNTELSPYQRATLGLRTLSQRQGMGDPVATAGLSEEERTALLAEYDALGKQLGLTTGGTGGAAAPKVVPMPLPSKKTDLQKDVVYDVPGRGPAKWDGEKFIKQK